MRYRVQDQPIQGSGSLAYLPTTITDTWWGRNPLGPWPYYEGQTTDVGDLTFLWTDEEYYASNTKECYDIIERRPKGQSKDHPCVMRKVMPSFLAERQEWTDEEVTEVITHVGGYPYNYRRRVITYRKEWSWDPVPGLILTPQISPEGSIVHPHKFAQLKRSHAQKCATPFQKGALDLGTFILEMREIQYQMRDVTHRYTDWFKVFRNGLFGWEFGLKPFLSDCMKIEERLRKTLASFDDEFVQTWEVLKKSQRVKTTAEPSMIPWVDAESVTRVTDDEGGYYRDTCRPLVVTNATKLWAISYVEYSYPMLDSLKNAVLQSLIRWGLTNPLLTAWQIMPKSFLVDWWLNLSGLLEKFDLLPLMYPPRIRRTTYHAKVWYGLTVSNTLTFDNQTLRSQDRTAEMRGEQYQRWVGKSPLDEEFFSEFPDLRQLMLTGLFVEQLLDLHRPFFVQYIRTLKKIKKALARVRE